jgi:hypothetical protein
MGDSHFVFGCAWVSEGSVLPVLPIQLVSSSRACYSLVLLWVCVKRLQFLCRDRASISHGACSRGMGSSEFGYCSYSTLNLDPSQLFDRDSAAQI